MNKTLFVVGIAGVLFSGYMSGVKFFTETCAFNESCPYFFGVPACYLGFAMFLVLAITAGLIVFRKISERKGYTILRWVSLLGILYAGYFTLGELPLLFNEGLGAYFFGLPTCALGLIFYLFVFLLSSIASRRK